MLTDTEAHQDLRITLHFISAKEVSAQRHKGRRTHSSKFFLKFKSNSILSEGYIKGTG
jgi:hypothetical protein